MLRTLKLTEGDSFQQWGQSHGEQFRGEIQSLVALRTDLTRVVGGFPSNAAVVAAAEGHVPLLREFSGDLCDELEGIAEGANLTPADLIILNHYTDLRDLGSAGEARTDEGCSIIYSRSETGTFMAQTWDMHASAIPYVMMLKQPATETSPAMWVLTIVGCLGMAGLSEAGVALTINNLHSTDARVGLMWSALVRQALTKPTAQEARDVVLGAQVGSGHHYLVADASAAYGIETSGTRKVLSYDNTGEVYTHTNHCLVEEVKRHSRVPAGSTTHDRLAAIRQHRAGQAIESLDDAWSHISSVEGYPRSVCTNMATFDKPHAAATCAGLAMDVGSRRIVAVGGFTHGVVPDEFLF